MITNHGELVAALALMIALITVGNRTPPTLSVPLAAGAIATIYLVATVRSDLRIRDPQNVELLVWFAVATGMAAHVLDGHPEQARQALQTIAEVCAGRPWMRFGPRRSLAGVIYRLVQEAVTNVLRHGRDVHQVRITTEVDADAVVLAVVDDGSSRTWC